MRTLTIILLIIAGGMTTPRWAVAEEPTAHEQMLLLSEEGTAAFAERDYPRAAELFAAAYELEPDPTLLKNEAIAWLKANQFEKAIDAASRFLVQEDIEDRDAVEMRQVWANAKLGLASTAMDSGTLEMAERLIAEVEASSPDPVVTERVGLLRVELDRRIKQSQDAAASERERDRDIAEEERRAMQRAEELRLQREIEAKRAAEAAARASASNVELERQRQQRQAKMFGFLTAGAGGAVVLSTLVYHLIALGWERQFYDIAEGGGDAERFEQLRDRLSIARVALPVLYTLGAAGIGAGVYVAVRASRDSEAQPRASIGFRWVFQ